MTGAGVGKSSQLIAFWATRGKLLLNSVSTFGSVQSLLSLAFLP